MTLTLRALLLSLWAASAAAQGPDSTTLTATSSFSQTIHTTSTIQRRVENFLTRVIGRPPLLFRSGLAGEPA